MRHNYIYQSRTSFALICLRFRFYYASVLIIWAFVHIKLGGYTFIFMTFSFFKLKLDEQIKSNFWANNIINRVKSQPFFARVFDLCNAAKRAEYLSPNVLRHKVSRSYSEYSHSYNMHRVDKDHFSCNENTGESYRVMQNE